MLGLLTLTVILGSHTGIAQTSSVPRLIVDNGQRVVRSPLIRLTLNFEDLAPVEMAFQHDDGLFSSWEPYQPTRQWLVENPEQEYQTYLHRLNHGQAFSNWDNEFGALAWGESFILESLLNMYETTGNQTYLERFVAHAEAVIAQGDDHTGRVDYRGQASPGWGTAGPITLARTVLPDSAGRPALEISGRSQLRQNQVAVRLTLSATMTDTLWVLDVHRSMAGRVGWVFSDTAPLTTAPDWEMASQPEMLQPGDAIAYDTYYPWFMIAQLRLYGIQGNQSPDDFELYTAMHTDTGEYTRIVSFTFQSLVENGHPILAFQGLAEWGRYWKVRYVGRDPLAIQAEPGALIRIYETGLPPATEQFSATTLDALITQVEQGSSLVKAKIVGPQPPQPLPAWRHLTPERYQMALHTGLITYPLLRFALIVKQRNLTSWEPAAQLFSEYATAALHNHDDEWRTISQTRGYYIYREDAPVWCNGVNLPFNQQAAIGRSLIILCALTSQETYCSRAEKIAQVLRDGLIYDPTTDSYGWYYWFGEGYEGWENVETRFIPTYPGFKGAESIYYASLDSDFAQLAYHHNMVFSRYDILRLANTFLRQLTTAEGLLRCYVTGNTNSATQIAFQSVDAFAGDVVADSQNILSAGCAYDDKMTATEYLGLTGLFPAVYQRVEAIQPFPPTVKNSGRAPYGLSQMLYHATWRLPPQPGDHRICVRIRDAQSAVSDSWCAEVALNVWRAYIPVALQGISPLER